MGVKEYMLALAPNKKLLPLKALLFLYNGAYYCLLPYLTVHMRQIGITIEETALVHALIPFMALCGPPVAGYLADKFGSFKLMIILCLVANAAFNCSLLSFPQIGPVPPVLGTLTVAENERSFEMAGCPNSRNKCWFERNNTLMATVSHCSLQRVNNTDYVDILNECSALANISSIMERKEILLRVEDSWDVGNSSGCGISISLENWNETVTHNCNWLYDVSLMETDDVPESCIKMNRVPRYVFWAYLPLRLIGTMLVNSCYALLDATALMMSREHQGEYGRQKLWSILATAIFPPIAGLLVDYNSALKGYSDYSPSFYIFTILLLITAMLASTLKFQVQLDPETKLKNVFKLLKSVEVVVFLLVMIVLGTMWGFIETFLYWYLLDLGSPKFLLGLTLTVGSGITVPFMFMSDAVTRKIGHKNIITAAMLFYTVRYFGYAIIHNPWLSLAFEALEVFTLHLMWVAAITYGSILAPKNLVGTMQGAIAGTHYGIGRGTGSVIGGFLMQHYGARFAFRCMGTASATGAVLFLVYRFITYRIRITRLRRASFHNGNVVDEGPEKLRRNPESMQPMISNVE